MEQSPDKYINLILNFRRVLIVVFLLGKSPASVY